MSDAGTSAARWYPSMTPAAAPGAQPAAPSQPAQSDTPARIPGSLETVGRNAVLPLDPSAEVEVKAEPSEESLPAGRHYDPMDRGDPIRFDEPPLDNPLVLPLDPPPDLRDQIDAAELPAARTALADLGLSLAGSLVRQGYAALRSPITTSADECMDELTAKYGTTGAQAKLTAARTVVAQAERKWPGVKRFLTETGLGNSARIVEQLSARHARRPGAR